MQNSPATTSPLYTLDLNPENVQAVEHLIPQDSPVYMVNLLRYREQADYEEDTDQLPCSGKEAYYLRYLPAFNQTAAAEGVTDIQVIWLGNVLTSVVSPPEERWDDVAIAEYPNFAAFRQVSESPMYRAQALPHRKAALEDWRLIAAVKATLPG